MTFPRWFRSQDDPPVFRSESPVCQPDRLRRAIDTIARNDDILADASGFPPSPGGWRRRRERSVFSIDPDYPTDREAYNNRGDCIIAGRDISRRYYHSPASRADSALLQYPRCNKRSRLRPQRSRLPIADRSRCPQLLAIHPGANKRREQTGRNRSLQSRDNCMSFLWWFLFLFPFSICSLFAASSFFVIHPTHFGVLTSLLPPLSLVFTLQHDPRNSDTFDTNCRSRCTAEIISTRIDDYKNIHVIFHLRQASWRLVIVMCLDHRPRRTYYC